MSAPARRAPRSLMAAALALGAWRDAGAAPTSPAAATMRDLQDHFAACFHPPKEAAGSRVTFYFSLTTRGTTVAPPRIAWFGFKGSGEEKARDVASFGTGFAACLPLAMDAQLAASIPGKVYFLQYIVAADGTSSGVLLRPFGSHGFGLQPPANVDVEPIEPMGPGAAPPRTTGPPPYTGARRLRPSGPFGRIIGPFRIPPHTRISR